MIARCAARDQRHELELARDWCVRRTLQVAHLGAAPRLTFVSVAGVTIVTCEPWPEPTAGTIRWLCEPARVELPTTLFVAEVARFGRALVDAMAKRIEAVAAGAIDGRAVVDVGALREQHAQRETMLAAALARGPGEVEDWDRIRRAIQMIEDLLRD